jgi:CHAT domain-containing protein
LIALLAAAVALASCRRDDAGTLREVDGLVAAQNFTQALHRVERGLAASAHTPLFWDLALRKVQILKRLQRRGEALVWLHSLGDRHGAAATQEIFLAMEQAAIERDLGQYAAANRDQAAALLLARSSGQQRQVANLDIRLAETYARLGQPEAANRALDEAERYEQERHDSSFIPYILNYRGLILLLTNRFEAALPPLGEALRLAQAKQLTAHSAQVMLNQAWCHYRLGNLQRAETLYQRALSIAAVDDRYLFLGHLGNLYRDAQQYGMAVDSYRQAADLARGRNQDYYSIWLYNLAAALCDQGKWTEADRINQQALEAKMKVEGTNGPSFETINAARIEASRGHTEAAQALYRQVIASSSTDPSAVLEANERLADLYGATGRPDAAQRQFEEALKIADERRAGLKEDENKLSYLAHVINLSQGYVEFLASRGESEAAFAAAEASRARLLRDRLNQQPEAASRRPIAEYEAAARRANATFLAYWIAPEKSYLWKITGTSFDRIPLPGEKDIRELVQNYQAGLEKDRKIDLACGRRLYDLLIAPVKSSPGGRYVIVPDGPLYGLNLETLPSNDQGHYWIEDATVMVTPSLDLLLSRQAKPHANGRLLLVGDANEWDDAFPKLISAQKEMQGIAKTFPSADTLAAAAATPAAYQRAHPEQYAYIHFAAHATASRDAPLDSSIVLSREGQQGKLSVRDLLGMHTNAELVTLSACHSAGARTYAGEGLVGLAWAFLQSGANNVIAGLWNVSDYSSPRLMASLYRGLSAGQSPADALRAAKLELIRDSKYTHAFYWGAFQLYAGARER